MYLQMDLAEEGEILMSQSVNGQERENARACTEFVGKAFDTVIVVGICFAVSVGLYFSSEEEKYRLLSLFVAAAAAIGLIAEKPIWYYYGISDKGLYEFFLFRYRRMIPWSEVKQIGIEARRFGSQGTVRGLIVTLSGAPEWPVWKMSGSRSYWRKHYPFVLYINNYNKSVSIIQKYYGKMDY